MSTSGTRCPTLRRKKEKQTKKKQRRRAFQPWKQTLDDADVRRFLPFMCKACLYSSCGRRQASGTEPICPLPLLGLHQNNSGQVIYRQYMKYGSCLIEGGGKKVSGDFTPCVRSMWRLSGLETEMIAYGMAREWDAITGVICACCLLLSLARVWMLQHSAYICVYMLSCWGKGFLGSPELFLIFPRLSKAFSSFYLFFFLPV